jgi:hypothetical protein
MYRSEEDGDESATNVLQPFENVVDTAQGYEALELGLQLFHNSVTSSILVYAILV